jgi:hypothetical protein
MRSLSLVLLSLIAAPAWALEGPVPSASTATTSVATTPVAFQPGKGKSVHLGKIEVPGIKAQVETLQEVKLAVKRPFDDDPAHFDDMVCRLGGDELGSHTSRTLECGTQGWFGMRRNAYGYGGAMENDAVAVSTLGHPWHVVRYLKSGEEKVIRDLLRELPAPGKGEVKVIDDDPPAPTEASH